MSNKLWICSYGQIRSVTAVNMYGGEYIGIHDRYCSDPSQIKGTKLERLCEAADEIYIFEDYDRNTRTPNTDYFLKHWSKFKDKIKQSLYIPDIYGEVNHPKLIEKIRDEIVDENPVRNRFNDFTQHEEAILLELLRHPNPIFICLDEGMEDQNNPHESTRKALLKELEESD